MKLHWTKNQSDTLIVFVTGWSMDPGMTQHLDVGKVDVMTLYEYHTIEELVIPFENYQNCILVGFSLGVQAANHFLKSFEGHFDWKIAVNGTDLPVDENYGIPPNTFEMTIKLLSASSKVKFDRRACGGSENYASSSMMNSQRTLENMRDEIKWSYKQATHEVRTIAWNYAVIGTQDLIFPVENMKRYWQEKQVPIALIDTPHFPFSKVNSWEALIQLTEKERHDIIR